MAESRKPPASEHGRMGKPFSDEAGRPLYVVGVDLESPEDEEAGAALREGREQLRAVLATSLDAAYRRNLQTEQFDYMSPAIEQVTGFPAEEMCALSPDEMLARIHPEDRLKVAIEGERIPAGGRAILEYRFQHKDGRYRWVADHADLLADQEGRPLYRIGFLRDITGRKLLEGGLVGAEAVGSGNLLPVLAGSGQGRIAFEAAEHGIRHTAWAAAIAGVILVVGAAILSRVIPSGQVGPGLPAASQAARQLDAENATLRLANGDLRKKLEALTRERARLRGKTRELQKQVAQLAEQSQLGNSLTATGPKPEQAPEASPRLSLQPTWPARTRGGGGSALPVPSTRDLAPPPVQTQPAVTVAMLPPAHRILGVPQPIAPDPPSSR